MAHKVNGRAFWSAAAILAGVCSAGFPATGALAAQDLPPGVTIAANGAFAPPEGLGAFQAMTFVIDIAPGAGFPLHSHPGRSEVMVIEGELTEHRPTGDQKVFHAGDAFMEEPNAVHEVKNTGSSKVRAPPAERDGADHPPLRTPWGREPFGEPCIDATRVPDSVATVGRAPYAYPLKGSSGRPSRISRRCVLGPRIERAVPPTHPDRHLRCPAAAPFDLPHQERNRGRVQRGPCTGAGARVRCHLPAARQHLHRPLARGTGRMVPESPLDPGFLSR